VHNPGFLSAYELANLGAAVLAYAAWRAVTAGAPMATAATSAVRRYRRRWRGASTRLSLGAFHLELGV